MNSGFYFLLSGGLLMIPLIFFYLQVRQDKQDSCPHSFYEKMRRPGSKGTRCLNCDKDLK